MRRKFLPGLMAALLMAGLAVSACNKDGGNDLTGPGGDTGGGGGGGGTVSSDPVGNGGWPDPDGTTPTPVPVDTSVFNPAPSDSGGTAGSDGTSTALLFTTSGSARYGLGTCGADGTWTAPDGSMYGPHNPNCLLYATDSTAGNNGKGICVTSPEGWAGLWLNPSMHPTSPYHPHCLRLGQSTDLLALSFPAQAELYLAKDGSGQKLLNFVQDGVVQAQLIYHGDADGTTTGSGVLVGHDNFVPWRTWSIGFGQPALNFTGALANGDIIAQLQGTGVEVVACSTVVGCSLVTLQISGM